MLIFRLLFGGIEASSILSNSKEVQDEVGSKVLISRILSRESSMITNLNQDGCPQSEPLSGLLKPLLITSLVVFHEKVKMIYQVSQVSSALA